MILTSNQIESFHQNGFLLLDNFFDQKELNDFRDAVTKIIRVNLLKASKDDHPEINTSDLHQKMITLKLIQVIWLEKNYMKE